MSVTDTAADTLALLRERLRLVEEAIAALEGHRPKVRSTRGRKGMGAEERLEVSARMRKYWDNRRQSQ
jgi:hypothetical protein